MTVVLTTVKYISAVAYFTPASARGLLQTIETKKTTHLPVHTVMKTVPINPVEDTANGR